MDQQAVIAALGTLLQPDERIRALFLAGSFGRGTADAFSDVDLLAVAEKPDQEAIAAGWRDQLDAVAPVVHLQRLQRGSMVIHAVLADWTRVDLHIVGRDGMASMAQDKLKTLFDREGLYAGLPLSRPDPGSDPRAVAQTISEFIRVLGLTHVSDGRGEYELGVLGYSLLRRMLADILIAEMGKRDTGGLLHLSRVIDAGRMQILTGLPSPTADRDSILSANKTIARIFFPRAKALAAKLGIQWPQSFEGATRTVLQETLPERYRPDW
ncbi:MAG: nucleotidyltransferase domain-containing protein [Bauldia sp.]